MVEGGDMNYDLSPIKTEYPYEPKSFDIGGHKMSYLDEGPKDAPALVMLHGNPTWSFYYRKLVSAFSEEYRVIVPDHIGCGLSDKPQEYDYTLANHISNLSKLLEELAPQTVTLVMHDWGGAIGMGYAVKNSDQIKSLVIFNTAAFLSQQIPYRIALCRIPLLGEVLVRGLNGFAGPAITMGMATARKDRLKGAVGAGYLLPYDNWNNRVAVHQFVKDIPLTKTHPSYETLKNIDEGLSLFEETPSFIAWGMKDFCFNEMFLKNWLERLKNVEAHLVEDAGHLVVEDAHERIIPWLQAFLKRHR